MTLPKKIKIDKHLATKLAALVIGVLFLALGLRAQDVRNVLGYIENNDPAFVDVVKVSDGDTIVVDINGKEERVRLIGVDTPEKDHPERPVQCFSFAATAYTTSLLEGMKVRLEADPTNSNRDRYDRLLRYVYLEDGTLVNAAIIKNGYGFAYLSFPFTKMQEFIDLEDFAKLNSLGLWDSCSIEMNDGYINTNPV